MKTAVFRSLFATVATFSLSVGAYATCTSDGGHQPVVGPVEPYGPVVQNRSNPAPASASSVYATALEASGAISSVLGAQGDAGAPGAPRARITVVGPALPGSSVTPGSAPVVPSARVTVVGDAPRTAPKAEADAVAKKVEPATTETSEVAEEALAEEDSTIAEALKGLVGTWRAVARHGDGELTTVELQLDDRGWAKLTVPGADGKPTTMKRRIELENEELKLSGPDAEITLGKLIDFDSRQMVLARAGGQITFVRP